MVDFPAGVGRIGSDRIVPAPAGSGPRAGWASRRFESAPDFSPQIAQITQRRWRSQFHNKFGLANRRELEFEAEVGFPPPPSSP